MENRWRNEEAAQFTDMYAPEWGEDGQDLLFILCQIHVSHLYQMLNSSHFLLHLMDEGEDPLCGLLFALAAHQLP